MDLPLSNSAKCSCSEVESNTKPIKTLDDYTNGCLIVTDIFDQKIGKDELFSDENYIPTNNTEYISLITKN